VCSSDGQPQADALEMPAKSTLTHEQVDIFLQDGVLVVPGIIDSQQVDDAIHGLHTTLHQHGVDPSDLAGTGHNLRKLSSTNGSGGVLDLFYSGWKMDVALNEKLWHATTELWEAAYCHNGESADDLREEEKHKWQPHGNFCCSTGYAYIDRIGYRIPTTLAEDLGKRFPYQDEVSEQGEKAHRRHRARPIQRSLTPHLDCCPDTFFSSDKKSKWRPIQCMVSLTDNLEKNTGGFEAVPGFHKTFHKWAKNRPPTVLTKKIDGKMQEVARLPAPCIGEYTHIRPGEDHMIMKEIKHIPLCAGDAVFWDVRIPHANSYRHNGKKPRAVVYCSFLPDVEINRAYVRRQLEDLNLRRKPRDQWIEISDGGDGGGESSSFEDNKTEPYIFSSLGRKLVGIDSW